MKIKSPETEEWKLQCQIGWQPKQIRETCSYCGGAGQVGGGLGDVSGPIPCYQCNGSGVTYRSPKTAKPDIPEDLRLALKKTWDKYWRKVNESDGS